jgi:hypothetical protein
VYELYGEYIETQKRLNATYASFVAAANRDIGESFVERLQSQLASRTSALNSHEANSKLINALANMVATNKVKMEAYGDVHKALNPTTGIISEQVTGYCAQFAEQVSGVIGQVWSYAMVVKPPESTRKGLTYKFPVMLEGTELSKDVAELSKGQTAIINLAITLCTRAALYRCS